MKKRSQAGAIPSRSARGPGHLVACGLLVGAIAVIYGQVAGFEFTNYDDPEYILDNPPVRDGLSLRGVLWAFTTTYQANWHPLTWLSLMLDARIAGLDPGFFHIVSLLLHTANTLLLYFVLDRMTGARWRSLLVAALFAVHPLHVESVAWIAERKDVLSALFWLLTLGAYVRYVERPVMKRYLLVVVFLALGLMAKPMLVTLPLVLLLLDFWPLGRTRAAPGGRAATSWELVREKAPFITLAVISGVVTLIAQKKGGALGTLDLFPLGSRVANAFVAYTVYLGKTFWPTKLAVFYPHPGEALPFALAAGAAATLAGVSVLAVYLARRRPYFTVGWFWYLVTLLPVIGFAQVGLQAMADRYTYLPLIGIFVIVAWGLPDLVARVDPRGKLLAGAAAASIVVLMVCAYVQIGHWRNSVLLFEHTLRVTGDNAVAENNLGSALYHQNRLEEAVVHWHEAVRINPHYAVAHNNLAGALMKLGKTEEAVAYWREAVRIKPNYSAARGNLAGALFKQGRIEESMRQSEQALAFEPDSVVAHYNLGLVLLKLGRLDEAGVHFSSAVRGDPKAVDARLNLGVVLAKQGRLEQAIGEFSEVLRLEPGNEYARKNLELARARRQEGN